jgi:hypothetical protein
VTKLLTVRRSTFFVLFLTLSLIGMSIFQGGTPVRGAAETASFQEDDVAYVESESSYTPSNGYYSGGGNVTFGLESAYVSESTVQNGPAVDGVDYQSYAGCISEGVSQGAASASYISVDTSGYSLPLNQDTYLPVSISGTYSGTDVYAETQFSGTVLAHAGFDTTNPDFELTDSSTSVGVTYDDGGGGGGCCQEEIMQQTSYRSKGGVFFRPLTLTRKGKGYKLAMRKLTDGTPSLTSGRVKNWKSNVPHTENLADVGLVFEKTSIQFDAASRTLNVKQKFRVKKAKKANVRSAAAA